MTEDPRYAAPATVVFAAWTRAEMLRRWDRPDVAVGTRVVGVNFTEHRDGTTTVVMTNRGLGDQQSRESHREGWEGSFDSLARLVCR